MDVANVAATVVILTRNARRILMIMISVEPADAVDSSLSLTCD